MVTDETLRTGGAVNGVRPGSIPTEDDLYWVGAMREVFVDSMRAGQYAALAVLACALAGWVLVAAAMIFRGAPSTMVGLIVWLLPPFWWSGSIAWALRVFSLRRYRYFANSPDSARKAIVRIARRKADQLFWAIACWVAGVVAFVCALLHDVLSP
jgi:hypothetical protein